MINRTGTLTDTLETIHGSLKYSKGLILNIFKVLV